MRQQELQQQQQMKLELERERQEQEEQLNARSEESDNEDEGISLTGLTIHSRQQIKQAEEESERVRLQQQQIQKQQEEEERLRKQKLEEEKQKRKQEEEEVSNKTERDYERLRGTVTESLQKQFLIPAKQTLQSQLQLLETQKKLKLKLKTCEEKVQILEHKLNEAMIKEHFEEADEYERSLNTIKSDMTKIRTDLSNAAAKFTLCFEQLSRLDVPNSSSSGNMTNKLVTDFIHKTNITFESMQADWNVKRSLTDERINNEREKLQRQEQSLELDMENVNKRRDKLTAQIENSTHSERVKMSNYETLASDLQAEIIQLEKQLKEKRALLKSTNENIALAKSIIEQHEKKFSEEVVLLDKELKETEHRRILLDKEKKQHERAYTKWQTEIAKWDEQSEKRDKVIHLANNLTSDVDLVSSWRSTLSQLQKLRVDFSASERTELDHQNLHMELQKHEKQTSTLQTELNLCESQLTELRDRKLKIQNEQLPDLNSKKATAVLNRKFKDAAQFQTGIKSLEEQLAKIDPECDKLEDKMSILEVSLRKNTSLLDSLRQQYSQTQKIRSENYLSSVLVPEWLQISNIITKMSEGQLQSSDAVVSEALALLKLSLAVCEQEISDAKETLEWGEYEYEELVDKTRVKLGLITIRESDQEEDEEENDDINEQEDTAEEQEETVEQEEEEQEVLVEAVEDQSSSTTPEPTQISSEQSLTERKLSLLKRQAELNQKISSIDAAIDEAIEQADYERCDSLDTEAQEFKRELYNIELILNNELAHVEVSLPDVTQSEEQTEAESSFSFINESSNESEEESSHSALPSEDSVDHNDAVPEESSAFSFIVGESNETHEEHEDDEAQNSEVEQQQQQEEEEREEEEEEEPSSFSFVNNTAPQDEEAEQEPAITEQEEPSSFSFINSDSADNGDNQDVHEDGEEEESSSFSFINSSNVNEEESEEQQLHEESGESLVEDEQEEGSAFSFIN